MNLELSLINFLKRYCTLEKPVLLGLSGGPDSLSLLYLLLELRQNLPIKFAIAHIDHGWRTESAVEAEQLAAIAKKYQITFHMHTLIPQQMQGNLEAACRMKRLHFFKQLCQEHGYQAVLLGHQADDQAETVLKRVLEGSGITQLTALQEVNQIDGVTLWRPLLSFPKKAITQWLAGRNLTAFMDPTNNDPTFLRARMRIQILPELSHTFGKKVSANLCHLVQEAQEVKEFITTTLEDHFLHIERGCWGQLFDLSHDCPKSPFAVKYLVREFCHRNGIQLSRSILATACDLVLSGQGNRKFIMGEHCLQIDRKRLFLLERALNRMEKERKTLSIGTTHYGNWQIKTEVGKFSINRCTNWKEVWQGHAQVTLPLGEYQLGPATNELSHRWTNEKVPAFLRYIAPVIWQEENIRHEFLSGRQQQTQTTDEQCMRLSLSYLTI